MILGVDYSHWQKGVDPAKLIAAGVSYAIVKAGEYYRSDEHDDDRYASNMTALSSAGLPHSSYYFYHPGAGNSRQARHWQRLYESYPHDMPPVLDCEAHDGMLNTTEVARQIRVMLEYMARISGRQPIIYTTAPWWSHYAGDPAFGADYPFWLAQYNTQLTRWTATIKPNIVMWQWTDRLKLPGCPTMDGNYWMSTDELYNEYIGADGLPAHVADQRQRKNIWSLSRANRQWLERLTR